MNKNIAQIKVLYLITDLKLGGAQTVLLDILKNLDSERFSTSVACLFGGDLPVGRELRQIGVKVIDLNMTRWWRLGALSRFYRLVREHKPEILHASLFHASLLSRLVGRLAGVPIILTWRQNTHLGSPIRESLNRLTAHLDDGVIAVSEITRQAELQSSGIPAKKIKVIHNCIDTGRFRPQDTIACLRMRSALGIPPGDFVAGMVGRLHPQKGIAHLLNAYAKLVEDFPTARLLIIGEGDLRQALENQTANLGLEQNVIFTGARTDIQNILISLDIFILPSLWEGLPLALLEAMSTGLPAIASNVGGTPEALIDGETGLLVPPGDEQALYQAIKRLIDEPDLRCRMGLAGRAQVKAHFAVGPTTQQLEDLYLHMVSEKRIQR